MGLLRMRFFMVKQSVDCKECSRNLSSLEVFHRHLRTHKITQAAYYQKHFPRYDKFDGKIILFKSREYYFSCDFNSRANLASWVKKVSRKECVDYIQQYLLDRKERKGLIYAPTQVELRTLMVPGQDFITKLVGDYNEFMTRLGFRVRFDLLKLGEKKKFHSSHTVLIDTREQMPLTFSLPTRPEALSFGDYRLDDNNFTHKCCIERKAVGDLYGSVSNGYDRFCRELNRALDEGFFMVILVEGSLDAVKIYPSQTGGWVHLTPEFIYHQVRRITNSYPNLQFLFVQNRKHASQAIERIFCSDGEYRRTDLQYAYDTGNLI